jgi:phosphoribosylglycinamide formyltransferase 1
VKIAVAVSGRGRSLQNLIDQASGYCVAAVISSKADAPANEIAEALGLPLFIVDGKAEQALALDAWLKSLQIEWVALAGFLKAFPALPSFNNRVINIHPALLPLFGGKGMYGHHVHKAVFAAGEQQSGATIHFVTEHYDEGQIIARARVSVADAQSPEDIGQRVFAIECQLYPEVLKKLACGDLPLVAGTIWNFGDSIHE